MRGPRKRHCCHGCAGGPVACAAGTFDMRAALAVSVDFADGAPAAG